MDGLRAAALLASVVRLATAAPAAARFPAPVEGDFVARDFRFGTGETLPVAQPALPHDRHAAARRVGRRAQRGADPARHRRHRRGVPVADLRRRAVRPRPDCSTRRATSSSCPTASATGNRASRATACTRAFPKYTYDDMVRAQHAMLVDGLKVNHLRLVLGTSMGAMHCWVWGEMYPDFVDGLVPLASAPTRDRRAQPRHAHDDHGQHHAAIRRGRTATTPSSRTPGWSARSIS